MRQQIVAMISLTLFNSVSAMESENIPIISDGKEQLIQQIQNFENIKTLFEEYNNATDSSIKQSLRGQIITGLNSLMQQGKLSPQEKDAAIEISDKLEAANLKSRLQIYGQEDYGDKLPSDLIQVIVDEAVQGATTEKIIGFLMVSKSFNKLLLTAPVVIDLSSFSGKINDQILETLAHIFPHMKALNLSGCKKLTVKKIIDVMKDLHNLTSLNLTLNGIGVGGAQAIAESPYMSNLTSLNLALNNIGVRGAQAIAKSPYMSNLTLLNLALNNIGDAGAQAIAGSPYMSKLISLNLEENGIGLAQGRAIARSPYMSNLISLNLGNNNSSRTGDEGARAMVGS